MVAHGAGRPRPDFAGALPRGRRVFPRILAVLAVLVASMLTVIAELPAAGTAMSITPGVALGPVRLGMSTRQATAILGRPSSTPLDGQLQFSPWGMTVTFRAGVVVRIGTTSPLFRTHRGAGVGISLDSATRLVGDRNEVLSPSGIYLTTRYFFRGIGFIFRDGRAIEVFVEPPLVVNPSIALFSRGPGSSQAGPSATNLLPTSGSAVGGGASTGGGGGSASGGGASAGGGGASVSGRGSSGASSGTSPYSPAQSALGGGGGSSGAVAQYAAGSATASAMVTASSSTTLPTATLSASNSISAGQSSALTWSTTNATSVTINGNNVSSSGSLVVSPPVPTTYTLIAKNSAGIAAAYTTVIVSNATITLRNDGTDLGARINSADRQLGSTCGIIDVEGGGNIASQIVVSPCHTLYFGSGTWTNSNTAETVLLGDNTVLQGHGWDTVIQEPPGDNALSYFIVRPYATHLGGVNQANNITVRNIQFSGVGIGKAENAASSAVNSGLLNGGSFTNLFFNRTHAIGLSIGESNVLNNAVCRNITVAANEFVNVGGGVPPNFSGGGGVSFAIVNGDNVIVTDNILVDALGNAFVDLEPNTGNDPITNIFIENNTLLQDGTTTGVYEPYAFGIVTHGSGGPWGPITISNNMIIGNYYYYQGVPGWYPGNGITTGIYVSYGNATSPDHDVTVANNTLKYISNFPIILDSGAYNNTVSGNTVVMPGNNLLVAGRNNTIQGNYVAAVASQGAYCFGIEERGVASNYNSFLGNKTTGDAFQNNTWIINPGANTTCSGVSPVIRVGSNSVSQGNILIPRPPFP